MRRPKNPGASLPEQRTSISMSKAARTLQSASAKTNWKKMVEVLFRADPHLERQKEIRRMISLDSKIFEETGVSYNPDQFQYILLLMLIISIVEKRTQELYKQEFSERCDAISKDHQLQDDQYWTDGNVPVEWNYLNKEFEERSSQILLNTLREYHQEEIAVLVETQGADQLFGIMRSIQSQFLNILENSVPVEKSEIMASGGSIPEVLQAPVYSKKR
jgi:hypothetical protein